MKLSWKNISITYKILGVLLMTILIFAGTIIFYVIPSLEKQVIAEKKETVKSVVLVAIGYTRSVYDDYEKGIVTREEMEKLIYKRVKEMKFGAEEKEYLWINDTHPRMVMHPYATDLEGRDLTNYADPTGKKLFIEMVETCKRSGEGFVEYQWQYKDQKEKIVPKISYVKLFKPLGLIIGSGIYIEDVRESVQGMITRIIGLMLAATAFLGMIIYLLARSITGPVKRIIRFAESLAHGDLTGRIHEVRRDEMGQLSIALDKAADDLENLIASIIESSQNLAQAVEQISKGNQQLSQRTSEQASSLEEIAATIEQAAATINQNAENASKARNLTETGTAKSIEGNRISVEAINSINEMSQASVKVANIISTINEIAFQTNLLALNAAVEAARAGEQGRGFAVVAGEVRNLAQRSGAAAKEIEVLIKDAIAKVTKSTELVNRTGGSLNEITEAARTSAQIITEIAAASQEQKLGINQITNAIAEMDTTTQQNASLVEETASASEEMANQARELLDMVQTFKINSAGNTH